MAKQRQNPDFRPTRIVQPVTSPVEQFYNPAGLAQLASFQNEMQIAQAFSGLSQSLQGFAQTYTQAEIEKGEREFLADAADSLKVRQKATEMIEQYGAIAPWRVRAYLTIMGGRQYGDQYAREAYAAIDSLSEPYGPNGEVRTDETVARELQDIAGKIETTSNFYVQTGFNQRREQVNSEIMGRVQAQRVEKARKLTEGAVVTEVMAAIDNTQDPEVMRRSVEERIKAARSTGTLADGGRAAVIASVMNEIKNLLEGPEPDADRAETYAGIFVSDPDSPDLTLSGLPLNADQVMMYRDLQDRITDVREALSGSQKFEKSVVDLVTPQEDAIIDYAIQRIQGDPTYRSPKRADLIVEIAERIGIPADTTDAIQMAALRRLASKFEDTIRSERAYTEQDNAAISRQAVLADQTGNLTEEELSNLPRAARQAVQNYRQSGYGGDSARLSRSSIEARLTSLGESITPRGSLNAQEAGQLDAMSQSLLNDFMIEFESTIMRDPKLADMVRDGRPTDSYIQAAANAFVDSKRSVIEEAYNSFGENTVRNQATVAWTNSQPFVEALYLKFHGVQGELPVQAVGDTPPIVPPPRTLESIAIKNRMLEELQSLFSEEIQIWKEDREAGGLPTSQVDLQADLESIQNRVEIKYLRRTPRAEDPTPQIGSAYMGTGADTLGVTSNQVQVASAEGGPLIEAVAAHNQAVQEAKQQAARVVQTMMGSMPQITEVQQEGRIGRAFYNIGLQGGFNPSANLIRNMERGYFFLNVPKDPIGFARIVDGQLREMPPPRYIQKGRPVRMGARPTEELDPAWSTLTGETVGFKMRTVQDQGDFYQIIIRDPDIKIGLPVTRGDISDAELNARSEAVAASYERQLQSALRSGGVPASPETLRRFITNLSLSQGLPLDEMLDQGTIQSLPFQTGMVPSQSLNGLDLELGAPDPRIYLYGSDEQFLQMRDDLGSDDPSTLLSRTVSELFNNQIEPADFIRWQLNLRSRFSEITSDS